MPTCPRCGKPVVPGSRGMVWGYRYQVDANGDWISGSEEGAFFHQDCWDEVKVMLPDDLQEPDPPENADALD